MITKKLKSACELIGVILVDHVVVGGVDAYSFAEHGYLQRAWVAEDKEWRE